MCYGFSEMVVFGEGPFGIFEWWRNTADKIGTGFGKLFQCMMCFPTWLGLMFSLIDVFLIPSAAFTPFSIIFYGMDGGWIKLLNIILDMGFTSGVCWCIYKIEEVLEAKTALYEKDAEDIDDGRE